MDKLYIDNKEVEMDGEINIYLIYRSNIMGDINKILGNNSGTIRIPHTLQNAAIIENAQLVMTDTRFPYLKHTADVVRDGITIIRGATVILMRTTPAEYELSLVWGASEGLRLLAEANEKLPALSETKEQAFLWQYQNGGTQIFPEAMYGFARGVDNGKYWYHPVISVVDIIDTIAQRYDTDILIFNQDVYNEMKNMCMPILLSTQPPADAVCIKDAGVGYSSVNWDSISSTPYTDGTLIVTDDSVKLQKVIADVKVKGYTLSDITNVQDSFYLSVNKTYTTEQGETEIDEILQIPCVRVSVVQGIDRYELDMDFFIEKEDDIETFNTGDKITFTFKGVPIPNSPSGSWVPFVVNYYYASEARLTFSASNITTGKIYYLWRNLPEVEILKFLKGIMQMFGLFAYLSNENTITLMDYPTFFSRKAQAQDWSEHLAMSATDVSEIQEFAPEGFYQNNLLQYKNDDANKGMNSSFRVENETLEADGEYITLPFDSVSMMRFQDEGREEKYEVARIPMYKQTNDVADANEWNPITEAENDSPKEAYILRLSQKNTGAYILNRNGLDWASLMSTYYRDIIASVQQAHYITATFYLDAVTLQNVDFGTPIYIRQFAAYFAIIEIKTKKNNLAEVKLLKLV